MRVVIVGLVCVVACGDSDPASPTFHGDVEPILNARCQSCHQATGIAPFSLVEYDEVVEVATQVEAAVTSGLMPPWGARPGDDCTPTRPWRDELALSDEEQSVIERWVTGGTPRGTPPDPPLAPPAPSALDRVDLEIGLSPPFVVRGPDDLGLCFPIDTRLPAGSWIQAVRVLPGNARVVHHVNVIADPTRNSLAARRGDGTVPCEGYPGFEQRMHLATWLPGGLPLELPPDVGLYIPNDSSLIIEIHYHPASTDEVDQTRVQIAHTPVAPRYAMVPGVTISTFRRETTGVVLLPGPGDPPGAPMFLVPAGASGHVESVQYTVPAETRPGRTLPRLWVAGLDTHMHLAGSAADVRVTRPGGTECLLHEEFDYRWQRFYYYDAPLAILPTLSAGDVLRVDCRFDNTMGNAALAAALQSMGLPAPIDLAEGWRTLEEMCQANLAVIYEWDGQPL